MKMLVGSTGFVGSNLLQQTDFDEKYHSTNISAAYGKTPSLLVFAGLRAEKYLANKSPDEDYSLIIEAYENIKKINPSKLVLISTVDVYRHPVSVDENTPIDTQGLHPYGRNRYRLEELLINSGINTLIVRLPGLYGKNLKKNFLYDIINIIPTMLTKEKMQDLSAVNKELLLYYDKASESFYKCKLLSSSEYSKLKTIFDELNFTAVHFTDSRAKFQFYCLDRLWSDIQIALDAQLPLINLAPPPVEASRLHEILVGCEFRNIISKNPPQYDFHTIHSELFGGANGYIMDYEIMLNSIKDYYSSCISG